MEGFLDEEELRVVRDESTVLVDKVKRGEYTALRVARVFCKMAAVAHQIVGIESNNHLVSLCIVCLLLS